MINLKFLKKLNLSSWIMIGLFIILILLVFVSLAIKKKASISPSALPLPSTEVFPSPQTSLLPSPSFPSISPSPVSFEKGLEPGIDDPLIGQELQKIYAQNPWLKKLPLTTDSYIIVYDWEKEAIRVRIIIDSDSPLSHQEQIDQVKIEAPKKLEEIGADLKKEEVYYALTP